MSYGQINARLRTTIPKSTFSFWFKDLVCSLSSREKIEHRIAANLRKGRLAALRNRQERKVRQSQRFQKTAAPLVRHISGERKAQMIALAMLYLAEGSKTARSSLMFGNSNPDIIRLFLRLLRKCYDLDESKFRVTIQCRSDQNIPLLTDFWGKVTHVSRGQFYAARIDPRSYGKVTRKQDYKGVCRIDYFSSEIDMELKYIAGTIEKKLVI